MYTLLSVEEGLTEAGQESQDSVFNYSRCMVWRGLLHMVQTSAERENDGHQLISDWRLDIVHFWNNNHNKYLILGHRLLAGNINVIKAIL